MNITKVTEKHSLGKDELWCEFFKCPNPKCNNKYIRIQDNYCSICGQELTFSKTLQKQKSFFEKENIC